jgi:hypothetical protein
MGLEFFGGHLCRAGGSFPFPSFGEQVIVGFRALDTAGHTSELRRVRLDGTPSSWQQYSLGIDQGRKIAPAQLVPLPEESSSPMPRHKSLLLVWILLGLTAAVASWVVVGELGWESSSSKRP